MDVTRFKRVGERKVGGRVGERDIFKDGEEVASGYTRDMKYHKNIFTRSNVLIAI